MPLDNPAYKEEGAKIIAITRAIALAATAYGPKSTMFYMALMSEVMKATQIAGTFGKLPTSERDEFFGEVWDEGIGIEPTALVHQIGFLSPEATEAVSDSVKIAAISYFNRQLVPSVLPTGVTKP